MSMTNLDELDPPEWLIRACAVDEDVVISQSVDVNLDWWNTELSSRALPGGPVQGLSTGGSVVSTGRAQISRLQLFKLGTDAGDNADQALSLLWHSLAWGSGLRPGRNNPERLDSVMADVQNAQALLTKAAALSSTDPAAAYRVLYPGDRAAIASLGPAFFTKFLYFAGGGNPQHGCLILDQRVAASLVEARWASLKATGNWPEQTYVRYVGLLARWAAQIGHRLGHPVRMDLVEYALFGHQPDMPGE